MNVVMLKALYSAAVVEIVMDAGVLGSARVGGSRGKKYQKIACGGVLPVMEATFRGCNE